MERVGAPVESVSSGDFLKHYTSVWLFEKYRAHVEAAEVLMS